MELFYILVLERQQGNSLKVKVKLRFISYVKF